MAFRARSAILYARSPSVPGRISANSSPPTRAGVSVVRTTPRSFLPTALSTSSPYGCPWVSLTALKLSRSSITRARGCWPRRARSSSAPRISWKPRWLASAVSASVAARPRSFTWWRWAIGRSAAVTSRPTPLRTRRGLPSTPAAATATTPVQRMPSPTAAASSGPRRKGRAGGALGRARLRRMRVPLGSKILPGMQIGVARASLEPRGRRYAVVGEARGGLPGDRRLASGRLDRFGDRPAPVRRGALHRRGRALDAGQRAALLEGRLALAAAGCPSLRTRRGGRDREGDAGAPGQGRDRG